MSCSAQQRVTTLLQHLQPTCVQQHTAAMNGTAAELGSTQRKFVKQEIKGRVGIIRLNRPSALNALNDELMADVGAAIVEYESSGQIGCIVLTGEGRAFAAGADIKEMADKSFYDMVTRDKISPWEIVSKCKIPIVAAVNGVALGGGCEIAMMCDIILASSAARFGQPEIRIGTIPGAGGTQRLTKALGKSKAMELVLTGNMVSAEEMERGGLVSKVCKPDELMQETMKIAQQIASLSLPLVKLAKQSVLASYDSTLSTGMQIERSLFQSTFALEDQKIGMKAFINKQAPQWKHQ